MRKQFALLAGLLLLPALGLAATPPPVLVAGRCNMGECSFTQIIATVKTGTRPGGTLIAAKERSAVVKAPIKDGQPQYDKVKPPKFFGLVKVSYAFCSTEKPAFVFYADGKFHAHVLDIGDTSGVSGFNTDSHLLYWAICHNKVIHETDLASPELAQEALSLGYHKVKEAEKGEYRFKSRQKMMQFFGL
jgi:hypothetical protein